MNHHRTKFLLAPLAACALILSLAACGSDDEASDTAAEATAIESTVADDMSSSTETTVADDMAGNTTDGMSTETTDTTDDMTDDAADMPGGEATVGDITVTDAWVRQPAEGQTRSAAYAVITNDGDVDVTLVGGSVPFGATVEIHETLMDDAGTMQMQEREDGFVIAAGESFTLEPGGPHIMMLDIDPADFVGEIDVTMLFDDGTELTVTAPVRSLDGTDMGDMADTDQMDEMDEMDDDMTETTDD